MNILAEPDRCRVSEFNSPASKLSKVALSKRSKAKKKRALQRRNGQVSDSLTGFRMPVIHQCGPFSFTIRLTNSGAVTNYSFTSLMIRGCISIPTSTTAVVCMFTCYRLRRATLYAQRYTGSTSEGITPLTMEFATPDAPRGIIVTGDLSTMPGVISRSPPRNSTLRNWKNVSNDSENILVLTAPADSFLDLEVSAYLNFSGTAGTSLQTGLSGLTLGAVYYGTPSAEWAGVDLPDLVP